jgi:hypothetical protein
VLEREFLGEFVRYTVGVGEDLRLTADQTHHLGQPVYDLGQPVHVGIETAQIRVLRSA